MKIYVWPYDHFYLWIDQFFLNINSAYGSWTSFEFENWTECSASCDQGYQFRRQMRKCTFSLDRNISNVCRGPAYVDEKRECNTRQCPNGMTLCFLAFYIFSFSNIPMVWQSASQFLIYLLFQWYDGIILHIYFTVLHCNLLHRSHSILYWKKYVTKTMIKNVKASHLLKSSVLKWRVLFRCSNSY